MQYLGVNLSLESGMNDVFMIVAFGDHLQQLPYCWGPDGRNKQIIRRGHDSKYTI